MFTVTLSLLDLLFLFFCYKGYAIPVDACSDGGHAPAVDEYGCSFIALVLSGDCSDHTKVENLTLLDENCFKSDIFLYISHKQTYHLYRFFFGIYRFFGLILQKY